MTVELDWHGHSARIQVHDQNEHQLVNIDSHTAPNDRDMSGVEYEAITMVQAVCADQIHFLKSLLAQIG